MNWYVVYTKRGKEDIVSERLRQQGIDVFSPKLKVMKYIRRKHQEVIEPLFPCYLFSRFMPDSHYRMITYTRGVRKVVGGTDGPWPVPDEVIDFIRAQERDGFITIRGGEVSPGDRVRIIEGPFAGFTGIFERQMKGSERVLLLLNVIGYQARMVVDKTLLCREP